MEKWELDEFKCDAAKAYITIVNQAVVVTRAETE